MIELTLEQFKIAKQKLEAAQAPEPCYFFVYRSWFADADARAYMKAMIKTAPGSVIDAQTMRPLTLEDIESHCAHA